MAGFNPGFQQIGENFIKAYYQAYDGQTQVPGRLESLAAFYDPECLFTFEGDPHQGPERIMTKLQSLPIKCVFHNITTVDCQPTADGGVLILVLGHVKSDEDQPIAFAQTFLLKAKEQGKFTIAHELFRLCLHNIA